KYESIETTLPKAKAIVPYVEKLITKAKIGDLHNRRQIISKLQTLESAHRLVDELAPKLKSRTSGHLRISKTRLRRGDNALLARVSFVDDLSQAPVAAPATSEIETSVSQPKQSPPLAEFQKPAKSAAKAKAAGKV
ncbi:MAG: 50S ribosomal protein L17, partial [Candidatus Saccharimonadales bacterium]